MEVYVVRGLYVHIPFCLKKCKYCDFCSFTFSKEDKLEYLSALFRNMDMYKGEKVDTVFIGGGTPTSLDAESLKLLLDRINSTLNLDNCSEFTVEMNPKTVDEDKLQVLKNGGVTRLSVGVQSFCDEELKRIGRVHTSQEAKETIEMIKNAGFENFSIDLMSALPGQTLDSFKYSLDTAIELNPAHISCYSLILEEGTPLYEEYIRGELNLPDEDTEREMYDLAVNTLNKAGYKRYEISNFSKENFSSTHNIKYWKCMEYIGVGLSAHSYLDVKRFSNSSDFDDYVSGDFSRYNEEKLDKKDMMSEFMFMGLRMSCGVSSDEFF
ncbi:MAG: radical SAM family heme chaperone HemW, partial [Ruminococcaceae bacterium]|nr:radical SAM family heme chaperone HemW [Oscillospiraceae bacterium]